MGKVVIHLSHDILCRALKIRKQGKFAIHLSHDTLCQALHDMISQHFYQTQVYLATNLWVWTPDFGAMHVSLSVFVPLPTVVVCEDGGPLDK